MLVAQKPERLSLRLTVTQDELLRRAADAMGVSITEYVVRHAVVAAETDLADRRLFMVDDAAWNELEAIMSRPPSLPPMIRKLLANPSVLEAP